REPGDGLCLAGVALVGGLQAFGGQLRAGLGGGDALLLHPDQQAERGDQGEAVEELAGGGHLRYQPAAFMAVSSSRHKSPTTTKQRALDFTWRNVSTNCLTCSSGVPAGSASTSPSCRLYLRICSKSVMRLSPAHRQTGRRPWPALRRKGFWRSSGRCRCGRTVSSCGP